MNFDTDPIYRILRETGRNTLGFRVCWLGIITPSRKRANSGRDSLLWTSISYYSALNLTISNNLKVKVFKNVEDEKGPYYSVLVIEPRFQGAWAEVQHFYRLLRHFCESKISWGYGRLDRGRDLYWLTMLAGYREGIGSSNFSRRSRSGFSHDILLA